MSLAARKQARIVMEELTGIREQESHSKKLNRIRNCFPFGELQAKIAYKAEEKGIPVDFVGSAYTSQICPKCTYEKVREGAEVVVKKRKERRGKRQGLTFKHEECGYITNSDYNAAITLIYRYYTSE